MASPRPDRLRRPRGHDGRGRTLVRSLVPVGNVAGGFAAARWTAVPVFWVAAVLVGFSVATVTVTGLSRIRTTSETDTE